MKFPRWRYDPNSNVFKYDPIVAVIGTIDQANLLNALLEAEQRATINRCIWLIDRMEKRVAAIVKRMQEGE